jgi:hypothetical protein
MLETVKPLPRKYSKILEELTDAGFNIGELLDGCYDPHEIFENSPTLVEMAIDTIVDELTHSIKNPSDYIDLYGRFGYTITVWEFVDDFLEDLRKYFKTQT